MQLQYIYNAARMPPDMKKAESHTQKHGCFPTAHQHGNKPHCSTHSNAIQQLRMLCKRAMDWSSRSLRIFVITRVWTLGSLRTSGAIWLGHPGSPWVTLGFLRNLRDCQGFRRITEDYLGFLRIPKDYQHLWAHEVPGLRIPSISGFMKLQA